MNTSTPVSYTSLCWTATSPAPVGRPSGGRHRESGGLHDLLGHVCDRDQGVGQVGLLLLHLSRHRLQHLRNSNSLLGPPRWPRQSQKSQLPRLQLVAGSPRPSAAQEHAGRHLLRVPMACQVAVRPRSQTKAWHVLACSPGAHLCRLCQDPRVIELLAGLYGTADHLPLLLGVLRGTDQSAGFPDGLLGP